MLQSRALKIASWIFDTFYKASFVTKPRLINALLNQLYKSSQIMRKQFPRFDYASFIYRHPGHGLCVLCMQMILSSAPQFRHLRPKLSWTCNIIFLWDNLILWYRLSWISKSIWRSGKYWQTRIGLHSSRRKLSPAWKFLFNQPWRYLSSCEHSTTSSISWPLV